MDMFSNKHLDSDEQVKSAIIKQDDYAAKYMK